MQLYHTISSYISPGVIGLAIQHRRLHWGRSHASNPHSLAFLHSCRNPKDPWEWEPRSAHLQSSVSWYDLRYGCLSAPSTLIRLLGLNASNFSKVSWARFEAFGKSSFHGTSGFDGRLRMYWRARLDLIALRSSVRGVPSVSRIRVSW